MNIHLKKELEIIKDQMKEQEEIRRDLKEINFDELKLLCFPNWFINRASRSNNKALNKPTARDGAFLIQEAKRELEQRLRLMTDDDLDRVAASIDSPWSMWEIALDELRVRRKGRSMTKRALNWIHSNKMLQLISRRYGRIELNNQNPAS